MKTAIIATCASLLLVGIAATDAGAKGAPAEDADGNPLYAFALDRSLSATEQYKEIAQQAHRHCRTAHHSQNAANIGQMRRIVACRADLKAKASYRAGPAVYAVHMRETENARDYAEMGRVLGEG